MDLTRHEIRSLSLMTIFWYIGVIFPSPFFVIVTVFMLADGFPLVALSPITGLIFIANGAVRLSVEPEAFLYAYVCVGFGWITILLSNIAKKPD